MKHDVFISYRRDGGEHLAGRVKDALKARGFSVFMDVEDLKSGRFDVALFGKIEEATNVIVILTQGCLDRCENEDDWLRQEIRQAIECKRNIVPIIARGFQMPSPATLPSDIAELVTFHGLTPASELFEANIDRLVSTFLMSKVRAPEVPERSETETKGALRSGRLPSGKRGRLKPSSSGSGLDSAAPATPVVAERVRLSWEVLQQIEQTPRRFPPEVPRYPTGDISNTASEHS